MCTLDVIFSSKVQEKGTASSVAGCLLGAHSGAHCTSDKRFFFALPNFPPGDPTPHGCQAMERRRSDSLAVRHRAADGTWSAKSRFVSCTLRRWMLS